MIYYWCNAVKTAKPRTASHKSCHTSHYCHHDILHNNHEVTSKHTGKYGTRNFNNALTEDWTNSTEKPLTKFRTPHPSQVLLMLQGSRVSTRHPNPTSNVLYVTWLWQPVKQPTHIPDGTLRWTVDVDAWDRKHPRLRLPVWACVVRSDPNLLRCGHPAALAEPTHRRKSLCNFEDMSQSCECLCPRHVSDNDPLRPAGSCALGTLSHPTAWGFTVITSPPVENTQNSSHAGLFWAQLSLW